MSNRPKRVRVFTRSGLLIALAMALGLLLGIVGSSSAQFFNFGGFQQRPQPLERLARLVHAFLRRHWQRLLRIRQKIRFSEEAFHLILVGGVDTSQSQRNVLSEERDASHQFFQDVLRERQGIAEAEVFSAVSLNDAQKTEMTRTLERVTGKKIEAKLSLDRNLLGGALVRVGDTIYDGSLRNRLNGLRERLTVESL